MRNVPGTLLVVRKKHRNNKLVELSGIQYVFFHENKISSNPFTALSVNLPYGAHVLLLSLRTAVGGKNSKVMKILYKDKILVGILNKKQCDKWFTYPNVWKKYYKNDEKD